MQTEVIVRASQVLRLVSWIIVILTISKVKTHHLYDYCALCIIHKAYANRLLECFPQSFATAIVKIALLWQIGKEAHRFSIVGKIRQILAIFNSMLLAAPPIITE